MANTGKIIGDNYKTLMPDFTDDANIQDALQMYHYGQANYDPNTPTVANSVEGHLGNLQSQITTLSNTNVIGEAKTSQPTVTWKGQTLPRGYIWVNTDEVATSFVPPGWSTSSTKTSSYTLVIGDGGTIVQMNSSSGLTLTVPNESTVPFLIGTQIAVIQINTGQVTVSGEAGVTVNGNPGLKLVGQWSFATLVKRASNAWILYGQISA
jgi:hypothetical protein